MTESQQWKGFQPETSCHKSIENILFEAPIPREELQRKAHSYYNNDYVRSGSPINKARS